MKDNTGQHTQYKQVKMEGERKLHTSKHLVHRFAKTEVQGYSVMDMGAAGFVVANALVEGRRRATYRCVLRVCVPCVTLCVFWIVFLIPVLSVLLVFCDFCILFCSLFCLYFKVLLPLIHFLWNFLIYLGNFVACIEFYLIWSYSPTKGTSTF